MIAITSQIDSQMRFVITDMLGKVVRDEAIEVQVGDNQIEVDASQLPAGIYMYALSNELGRIAKKLIVR